MKSRPGMTEESNPIKNNSTLNAVEYTLLHHFKLGKRNLTIFKVGMTTLLRVSDVLNLKYDDVFGTDSQVKSNAFTIDQKTGKHNTLYLKPCQADLEKYHTWLVKHQIHSKFLFPNCSNHKDNHYLRPISTTQFYRIMRKTGDYLGLNGISTHTMRKTGAYIVYEQTHFNIALVMKLLNQSSEGVTLRYLGLNDKLITSQLDNIDFNKI